MTEKFHEFSTLLGVRRTVKSTTAAVVAGSLHTISANFIPKFTNMGPTSTSEHTSFLIHSETGGPTISPKRHAQRERQPPSPLHQKVKLDRCWAQSHGRIKKHCTRCSVSLQHMESQLDQRKWCDKSCVQGESNCLNCNTTSICIFGK